MSRQIQMRRGTAAQHNNFTGVPGEITVDTTNNTIRVHDGQTPGGTATMTAASAAHAAMPSNRHISLTLDVSGTIYTAPADGWFVLNKTSGVAFGKIDMINGTTNLRTQSHAGNLTAEWVYCCIPVSKNDQVRIDYSVTGTTNSFFFVYANGSN